MGKLALSVLWVGLLLAPAAAADPDLSVAFVDCDVDPLGKQAVLRALALELGRSGVRDSSPDNANIALRYRCDGSASVLIRRTNSALERELRVDDVPARERARALALAVAELARAAEDPSSSVGAATPVDDGGSVPAATESTKPAPRSEATPKAPSAAPDTTPSDGLGAAPSEPAPTDSNALGVFASGALRLNFDALGLHYGGALGLDWRHFRAQVEASWARTSVPRGSITSGVLTARFGRAVPLLTLGKLQAGAALSGSAGINWATGDSSVVGTRVRRVLMPYADARLSLWATGRSRSSFTPLCEVFAGRAAGIVATADAESVIATGGWFSGVELGLWL
ncbi:MAG: hypothetical protein QM756_01945 [Polyangiaceae bacterium]